MLIYQISAVISWPTRIIERGCANIGMSLEFKQYMPVAR